MPFGPTIIIITENEAEVTKKCSSPENYHEMIMVDVIFNELF